MRNLSREKIDAICEEFELSWETQTAGPRGVSDFVGRLGLDPMGEAELVAELAQIDIERVWMTWDKLLDSRIGREELAKVTRAFESLPRLPDYLKHLPSLRRSQTMTQQLARVEAKARDAWGDAIGRSHYQAEFGLSVPVNETHLPNTLQLESVSLGHRSRGQTAPIRGALVVKRFLSSDSRAHPAESSPEVYGIEYGIRIGPADRDSEAWEQLSIQLINPRYAIIHNLSRQNDVLICGTRPLKPLAACIQAFEFVLRWCDLRLIFRQQSEAEYLSTP